MTNGIGDHNNSQEIIHEELHPNTSHNANNVTDNYYQNDNEGYRIGHVPLSRDRVIMFGIIGIAILLATLLAILLRSKMRQNASQSTPVNMPTNILTNIGYDNTTRMARTDLIIRHLDHNFSLPNNYIALTKEKIMKNIPVIVPAHIEHYLTLIDTSADLYCSDLIYRERFLGRFNTLIAGTCTNQQIADYVTKTVALPHLCMQLGYTQGIGRSGDPSRCP